MTNDNMRMPAEWEGECAVMVAWPHGNTDWHYMLQEAEDCYDSLVRALARHATVVIAAPEATALKKRFVDIDPDRIVFFNVPTNDTWVRDYGPITTIGPDGNYVANDFRFNAWGGKFKSDLDNRVTKAMAEKGLLRAPRIDHGDFVLEGGSIESDGKGTILTTSGCLLTPTRNPSLGKAQIEERLASSLGARKVLWLDKGEMIGDDTDGHIDTIARFAPHNTILFNGTGWGTDADEQSEALEGVFEELRKMTNADGEGFNLVELPLPEAVYDADDGHRLPATYANFLVVNDALLLPTYGQPLNDIRAEMALKVAFPDLVIERVDCRALIRQHGSLHCATMQIPHSMLNC